MANKTTVQGWLNKAAAELNPSQGHTVTVSVTGVESVPDYTVHWYQNGQELASGTSITVTDTSAPLYYEIVLDNDALKQYSMTNGSGAVEFDTGNSTEITVTLASHQTVSVEGTVKGENKQLISGATVTLTQNYSATVSEPLKPATTDASGAFNIPSAKAVPSVIKISAPGYYDYTTAVSLDVEVEADADATSVNLETFQLTPLPDSQVTLSLSLQAAAAPGEPPPPLPSPPLPTWNSPSRKTTRKSPNSLPSTPPWCLTRAAVSPAGIRLPFPWRTPAGRPLCQARQRKSN